MRSPINLANMRLRVVWLISLLWVTSPFTVPLLLFHYIHNKRAWGFWQAKIGWGAHPAPVWPKPRTHIALLMLSVPIWAGIMASWTILRTFVPKLVQRLRRLKKRNDAEYELLENGSATHRRGNRSFPPPRLQYKRLAVYLSICLVGLWVLATYPSPGDTRYKRAVETAVKNPKRQGHGNGEKIFIAAMFYNNEAILPYWTEQITKLIYYLGTDNVFVSVVESNSGDQTPALLEAFDAKLENMGVAKRILVHDTTIPRPPSMDTAPPRIQFLSAVRNKALEPLVENGGYDRAIFSNDVFIEADSIVELLQTRDGDWDMVCGIDLFLWGLYDAWVTRDRLGRLPSGLWPYFFEDAGMQAVMKDEPAPVFTCWNGIIAFRTDPVLPVHLRSGAYLSNTTLAKPLPSTHPAYPQPEDMTLGQLPPLKFRASAKEECFSSESFLFPYDLRRQFDMQQIFMNTRVINSYNWEYYFWFKYVLRHWLVRWWIEKVENGAGMHLGKMVVGQAVNLFTWDGGDCQPWH